MQLIESEMDIKVFISYAHKDWKLRNKLEEHLSPLKYAGKITIWQDQEIPAGANWEYQIDTHLNEADLILLLVSASFIASKYCWNKEVQASLERHRAGTVRVIPIILRSIFWQDTPLGQLQALPTKGKPVTLWRNQDAAFEDVVLGIQNVLEHIRRTIKSKQRKVDRWNESLIELYENDTSYLEEPEKTQLTTVPAIAAQRDWKAWVATFDDVAVSYIRPNPSEDYVYIATGTNKKEPGTFWYTSPPDIGSLCERLVDLYGRQNAVDSSEWVVKEIFPFLN